MTNYIKRYSIVFIFAFFAVISCQSPQAVKLTGCRLNILKIRWALTYSNPVFPGK
jgi:hypothetical protein